MRLGILIYKLPTTGCGCSGEASYAEQARFDKVWSYMKKRLPNHPSPNASQDSQPAMVSFCHVQNDEWRFIGGRAFHSFRRLGF
eukprot:226679-Prorocentrum_minimum.AAC.1